MKYIHTHREEWVLRFFERMNILDPEDIDELSIARHLRIFIKETDKPSYFERFGYYQAILINRDVDPLEYRMHFFHELGHLIRQTNKGFDAPASYTNWLEWDAKHFEFYAAMPWHMMKKFNLESPYIVEELRDVFKVPEEFVKSKLLFVSQKRKEYDELELGKASNLESGSYKPDRWSNETVRVMDKLKQQTGQEVINHVGLFRRD